MMQQQQQMTVSIVGMRDIFFMPVRYDIPALQRRYTWTQEDQWEPLWDDVIGKVENYLASGWRTSAHFLGAIVIQSQPQAVGMFSVWTVVDGQQRLTTIQLLLDAAQEVFESRGYKAEANRLSNLVLNNEDYRRNDPNRTFKILPTINDRKAFWQAMNNDLRSDIYEQSRIVQAHEFFKSHINDWLEELPDENDERVEALEMVLTSFLKMVVIQLGNDDDAHLIFETLNARGTPLLESDMVKNLMLQEAGYAGITDETKVWGDFGSDWWIAEITQGRLIRPRVDVLLNYWLVMRKKDDVPANRVFRTFSDEYRESGESIEAIATHIARVGKAYRALEDTGIDGMETFLYRRRVMQAGAPNPALLWLLSSDVPQCQIDKAVLAIESFLVRRMICGITASDYNRLFIGLVAVLEQRGVEQAGNAVVEYLGSQTAHARRWPDDHELERAFVARKVYGPMTQGRLRIVLEGIEEGLRTDKAEDRNIRRDLPLTIEHIMPQAWGANWELPDDVEDHVQAERKRERDHIVHTIGNLTLVTKRLNSTLSNAPWQDKRGTLGEHSVLFLNKTLRDDAPDVWDEAAIEERAKQLCAAAAKVWPHADGIS